MRIAAADPALALDWAAAEGWNPGLDDAARFAAADPDGFLYADGDAGSVSLVRYDERHAFLGLFIVRPELRGGGVGGTLFRAALDLAGDRVVGLDGVVDQQPYYRRMGFAYRHANRRWQAPGGAERPGGDGRSSPDGRSAVVAAAEVDFAALAAYDRAIFAAPREAFLRGWVEAPTHTALALLDGGEVRGLGVLRACRAGAKVGPLFADDAAGAAALLGALLAAAPVGEPVTVDVPDVNGAAVALVRERGMREVFETARMERRGAAATDWARTFGVTTLELG